MRHRNGGFTLIELVVAMAIVGILTALALPAYQSYVLRTKRTAAEAFLSKLSQDQQSFYTDQQRYGSLADLGYPAATDAAGVYIDDEGQASNGANSDTVYRVTLLGLNADSGTDSVASCSVSGSRSDTSWVAVATPMGSQQSDDLCGTLCLSSTGQRGASGDKGISGCWR